MLDYGSTLIFMNYFQYSISYVIIIRKIKERKFELLLFLRSILCRSSIIPALIRSAHPYPYKPSFSFVN